MTRWHNYYIDGHPHFCTSTVQDWECVFTDDAIQVIYEEWSIARELLGVKIFAFVVCLTIFMLSYGLKKVKTLANSFVGLNH